MHAQALLLDFDGVLVDSFASVEIAWRQWADEHALEAPRVLQVAHGVRAVETIRQVAPHLDAVAEALRVEEREIGHTAHVRAFAGAAELLAGLPEDRWAIVTSGTLRLATARLEAIGLPTPKVFVTADDVASGKPAPDPYLLAAERLGVAPEDCVVIEDSPAGVTAGRSAGMRVIAVTTTHDPAEFTGQTATAGSIAAIGVQADGDGPLRIWVTD